MSDTIAITRTEFRRAIHAGIEASGMPPAHAVALYRVGREAEKVHTNFEGCPLTLAGLYSDERSDGYVDRGTGAAFVQAYDDALGALGVFRAPWPNYIQITNGE